MVGKTGTVHLSIEAGGHGEIILNVSGATQLYVATSKEDIAQGTSVLVIGRTADGSLVVVSWYPSPNIFVPQDNQ